MLKEKGNTGIIFLFGSWYEAIKGAPWIAANLKWTDAEIGRRRWSCRCPRADDRPPIKGYVPDEGHGTRSVARSARDTRLGEPVARLGDDLGIAGRAVCARGRPGLRPARHVRRPVLRRPGVRQRRARGPSIPTGGWSSPTQDYGPEAGARRQAAGVRPRGRAEPARPTAISPQRLKVAFQSFVGLANIGAAQKKAPLLELGSETCRGGHDRDHPIHGPRGTASATGEPASHSRYNFSPSAAQVGKYFILSSSTALARDLVEGAQSRRWDPGPGAEDVHPHRGGRRVRAGRGCWSRTADRLVMQAMLKQGRDQGEGREAGRSDRLAASLPGPRPLHRPGRCGRHPVRIEARSSRIDRKGPRPHP